MSRCFPFHRFHLLTLSGVARLACCALSPNSSRRTEQSRWQQTPSLQAHRHGHVRRAAELRPRQRIRFGRPGLNNGGVFVGFADTATPDATPPLCFNADCFVSYAFRWQNGVMSNLGSLLSGWSSAPHAISPNGMIAGYSENGNIDPLLGTAEVRAVLWRNGGITSLGTLPEGGYESAALAVNSVGQVVGGAMNAVPDANPLALYSVFPIPIQTTQTRAFLWEKGVMRDLGILAGPTRRPSSSTRADRLWGGPTPARRTRRLRLRLRLRRRPRLLYLG